MTSHLPRLFLSGCAVLLLSASNLAADSTNSFPGNWAFVLPDGNPAWLNVADLNGQLQAELLWSVGSAKPVSDPKINDDVLTFERKISWKPFGEAVTQKVIGPFRSIVKNGDLHLSFSQVVSDDENAKPEQITLIGKRIPPAPPAPDLSTIRFGNPIDVFNGRDLTGWKLSNPKKKNGWSVVDGCLVNETPKQDFAAYGEYGNLITTRNFTDFELTIEYNVPAGGNSGIYLRGMYEAQVVDRDSRMQGIQGPGAIFGRINPAKNAAKPGGQWNTYVLTLVDRHITVVLNGEKVIDNQLLEGCTGGGIQANDSLPGPIFLQGDHTAVKYRTIRLRPVVD